MSSVTTVSLCGEKPTNERLSAIRESWMDKITDLVNVVSPKVPPFRMINHEINLIDSEQMDQLPPP